MPWFAWLIMFALQSLASIGLYDEFVALRALGRLRGIEPEKLERKKDEFGNVVIIFALITAVNIGIILEVLGWLPSTS